MEAITRTEISERNFQSYERVRQSGVTNMCDLKTVCVLTGLTKEQALEIMQNYEEYRTKYPDKQALIRVVRAKLLIAFADLRKQGYLARANYLCCGSCAGYSLATKAQELKDKRGKETKGCVFWHAQDDEALAKHGQLYIAYGGFDNEKGHIGLTTAEVGKAVIDTLQKQGLHPIWNGNENDRILIDIAQEKHLLLVEN